MNNNIFQFKRIGMLINRTFQQNSKTLLNNALVLAGLPILFLLIDRLTSGEGPSLLFRGGTLTFLVVIFFVLSPFFYHYFYNHPKKGLSEVMLPASVLEKFVIMQLGCMIFAPLMALIFFGGSDALLTTLLPKYQSGYAIVKFFSLTFDHDTVLLSFLSLQAIFFCNMLFVRRKLLKTTASFMVVNLLILIVLIAVFKVMESFGYFNEVTGNMNFSLNERGLFEFYTGDHPLVSFLLIFRIFIETVMPIILMIGSYRLMKTNRY